MEIGFETIIYIILGLIFVFAQIAKKKKKNAQAQQSENKEYADENKPSSPSVLEQLLGIPEQNQAVEKPVDNIMTLREEFTQSFHQPEQRISVPEPKNEAVSPPVRKNEDFHDVSKKQKLGSGSVFNLRQAVIYKAVLERKNF